MQHIVQLNFYIPRNNSYFVKSLEGLKDYMVIKQTPKGFMIRDAIKSMTYIPIDGVSCGNTAIDRAKTKLSKFLEGAIVYKASAKFNQKFNHSVK